MSDHSHFQDSDHPQQTEGGTVDKGRTENRLDALERGSADKAIKIAQLEGRIAELNGSNRKGRVMSELLTVRKKPVVVHAVQFDGTDACYEKLCRWVGYEMDWNLNGVPDGSESDIVIETLEGEVHCQVGDYVIKGVAGEFYPCKPDIFEQTYEIVEVHDEA